MAIKARPGEQYTLRRKLLKLFGGAFHIYDAQGNVAAYCAMKAFKLKEDLRVYTAEDRAQELFRIGARSIIDFGSTYDVSLPSGEKLGSLRRKGMKSSFLRDEWAVLDHEEREIATLAERGSTFGLMLRRYGPFGELAYLISPQRFDLVRSSDQERIASLRQHANPIIYRLGISIEADDQQLDELMVLAAACVIGAIEGRQSS